MGEIIGLKANYDQNMKNYNEAVSIVDSHQ